MELELWQIRDVKSETKRKIKAYAARNGLTLAQALEKLADMIDNSPQQ